MILAPRTPPRSLRRPSNQLQAKHVSTPDPFPQILAARLKKSREEARARPSQQDVAAAIGCKPADLSKWETAYQVPRPQTLALLARHYGVTTDYLLGLTDIPSATPAGSFLVDQDVLDGILAARTPSELMRFRVGNEFPFWTVVPDNARLIGPEEAERLREQVQRHVIGVLAPQGEGDA